MSESENAKFERAFPRFSGADGSVAPVPVSESFPCYGDGPCPEGYKPAHVFLRGARLWWDGEQIIDRDLE